MEALDAPAPAIPVVVLASDRPFFTATDGEGGEPVGHTSGWFEARRLLTASLGGTLITQTNGKHFIAIENAPLVNAQICAVVSPTGDC